MTTGNNDTQQNGRRAFIKAGATLGAATFASSLAAQESDPERENPWLTVSPRSESASPWLMPAHFGMPEWQLLDGVPKGDSLYDDVTLISIDYLTDEEKLTSYLPRPYELDGPPVVTVAYSMNRNISWLAGRDYNIIAVSTRATYPRISQQQLLQTQTS